MDARYCAALEVLGGKGFAEALESEHRRLLEKENLVVGLPGETTHLDKRCEYCGKPILRCGCGAY